MNEKEVILFKIPGRRLDAGQAATLRQQLTDGIEGAPLAIDVYAAVEIDETYVYYRANETVGAQRLARLRARVEERYPGAGASVMRPVQDIEGASRGKAAFWHYIVETDVVPDMEADLNAWYNEEHLPGLASVPGTTRAQRFVVSEGGPRYHACYDLETEETFGCPAWLAVRATDWSSRVRPAFRNTKRTMFKIVK